MGFHRPLESDDADLLAKVSGWSAAPSLDDLSTEALREVANAHGIDFATALLYDRLRRSPLHGRAIQEIESPRPADEPSTQRCRGTIAIVPGAFYRDRSRQTGADGHTIQTEAARLGFEVSVAPTVGFGSLEQNAEIICRWLTSGLAPPIVLVSLSKGTADVKFTLHRDDAARVFAPVSAWVSLSGMWWGSPLVNWLEARPLRSTLVRCVLWYRGHDYRVVRQLGYGPRQPLSFGPSIPEELRLVHVVGFPLKRHLSSRLARRGHRRLAPLGPNDGAGMVLGDVSRLPGTVYPVWGADHYLRPAHTSHPELICRVLLWVAQRSGCKSETEMAVTRK